MFSYRPLNILLAQKCMNKGQLRKEINVSSATMAKLSKNEYVNMEVLNKICEKLGCKIEQVIEYTKEN